MKKPRIVEIHNITYSGIPRDENGWVDVKEFLPILFDLVELDCGFKCIPGWYTGHGWDGKRFKKNYIVVAWRKLKF